MRLFARDIKGNIKEWSIEMPIQRTSDNIAIISTGRLNGSLIETTISHPDIKKEIASRIAKKRKEGYVSINDLGYNNYIPNKEGLSLGGYLEANLPKYNTDHNNNLKPMKCQKFKEGTTKYPVLAQPKLNGLRCVLRWETWIEDEGMFAQQVEGAKLRTKEGLEYYMPHIVEGLTKNWFETKNNGDITYDGELYCHNMPLNKIKASCPMVNSAGTLSRPSGNPKDISFHCFDAAIPDLVQTDRLTVTLLLDSLNHPYIKRVNDKWLYDDEEVLAYRDYCITQGFEGCVIRDPDEEYAFGFRPSFIRKCKTHMDSEFLVIDVVPKPSDNTLPLFILKNDINNETFECNPSGDWTDQRVWMINKDEFIGTWATVRYRERSGVKKVPFHANVIGFRKLKNEG